MAVGRMFTVVSSPAWERTTFKLRDYRNHSFLTAFIFMEPAPSGGSRIMIFKLVLMVITFATYVCLLILVLVHRRDVDTASID